MKAFAVLFVALVAAGAAVFFLWTSDRHEPPLGGIPRSVGSPADDPAFSPRSGEPGGDGAPPALPTASPAPHAPADGAAPPAPPATVRPAPAGAVATPVVAPPVRSAPPDRQIAQVWAGLENLRRVVRDEPGAPPPTTNAEFTRRLLGGNRFKEVFLEPGSFRVNEAGELVDAWEQPYFFHLVSSEFVELRSAGPDRRLWSADDLLYPPPRPDSENASRIR